MKLSQVEWVTVGKSAVKEYGKDDIAGLAAEMAYWIVFSLFPFFIFLATLTGIINRLTGQDFYSDITSNLFRVLEPSTARTISDVLGEVVSPAGGALSFGAIFGALLTLNSASSAIETTMKAFNRAYGVEETRNLVIKKLTALGLTFVLILLIIGGAIFLSIGGDLVSRLNLGPFATIVLSGLRVVGALAAITLGLAILYWRGPNVKQQFAWISPGSVIATVALILFVGLFTLYVRFIAGSGVSKTYGTLAGLIIFLIFLRFASTIILLGAEFNAAAALRYDSTTIRDKVENKNKVITGAQPEPHPQAVREAGVAPAEVAAMQGNGTAEENQPADPYSNPNLEERLRALRARPAVNAQMRVQAEHARQTAAERAAASKPIVVALLASVATAIAAAIGGTVRHEPRT